MEPIYQKRGYLTDDFRLFHLTDIGAQEFTFHYHDFDKIMILLSGKVTYVIEGRSYDLKPYDIVLINHNEIHRPFIDDSVPYERIIIYLSPDFLSSFQTDEWDLRSCFDTALEHGSHVLRTLHSGKPALLPSVRRLEAAIAENGYAGPLYCRVLFLEFLIQLNRTSRSRNLDYPEVTASDARILAIIEYINHHLADPLTIDILAMQFHFSRYYLMRLFKQATGFTVARYITSKRLLAAKEMLAFDMPITEICYQCGFQNYSTFLRAYKAEFGATPRAGRG